ncbi:VWA domain-containing protein [Pseudanabaenaceae cyanobacterium LEGE 13415]|nr:VWA domain-containing protein [Pseudanabaenaceae cyanobacterium LEGE 13415]
MPKSQVPDTIAAPSNATIPDAQSPNYVDPQQFQALYQKVIQNQRKADILFVLDCTGSMQGEIDAVRDAITSFADTIQSQSVRARVGLIEFRDRLIGEEQRVVLFDGEPFTSNPTVFREQVAKLRAKGGGDEPESSLDAVLLALDQPFDPSANKVIVLVTDAPPHIPDATVQNIDQVVQKMREITVDQFYVVMKTNDSRSQVYLRLLEGRRGLAFEIGKGDDFRTRAEDFKRTLMALGKTISTATR